MDDILGSQRGDEEIVFRILQNFNDMFILEQEPFVKGFDHLFRIVSRRAELDFENVAVLAGKLATFKRTLDLCTVLDEIELFLINMN